MDENRCCRLIKSDGNNNLTRVSHVMSSGRKLSVESHGVEGVSRVEQNKDGWVINNRRQQRVED